MYVNVIFILHIYIYFFSANVWIGKYDKIMRLWVSNIVWVLLQYHNSVSSDFNLFLTQPTHLSHPPLWVGWVKNKLKSLETEL